MSELKGINYLRKKLARKRIRVKTRYRYYDQKFRVKDLGISTPKNMRDLSPVVGWCTKAVDAIADRLVFRGFENDYFNMKEIYELNNMDVLINSGILSALISSCSFVYISKDQDGFPQLQVIDGANATGVIDSRTNLLTEGYAILDTDDNGVPTLEAYFTPDYTEYYQKGKDPYQIDNPARYCLLVPWIYKPSDTRPFGHSRITRACMEMVQGACRTIKRSEVTAEYYSYPQKYLLGRDPKAPRPSEEQRLGMSASNMLDVPQNKDGSTPNVGQFSQQSMAPHNDQLATYVKTFCGETGLTADDLGYVSANPSSAEAIETSHESLRLLVDKAQQYFAVGILNVGYLSACVRDDKAYLRSAVANTKVLWKPTFKPSAATLGVIGDGALKINQAEPGFISKTTLEKLTGIESE